MTTPHKQVVCAGSLEMVTNPPSYFAVANSPYTVSASGAAATGASIAGSSQYTLWNAGLMPLFSSGLILAGSSLTLPISNVNLPPYLFDAIINVNVNGSQYPIAASNSPDNGAFVNATQPVISKCLYWIDLWSARYGNLSNYDYMWATKDISQLGYTVPIPLKLYFSTPTPVATNFTATITHHNYGNSGTVNPVVLTATVPAGSNDFVLGNVPSATTYGNNPGFIKIVISTTDNNFRSLLPTYHWGIGGALVSP